MVRPFRSISMKNIKYALIKQFDLFPARSPKVVIAGSKNDPIFPEYQPDIFVGANAGISHAKRYSPKTLKVGVITNQFLTSLDKYCDIGRGVIAGTQLDALIVVESIPKRYEDILPNQMFDISPDCIFRVDPFSVSCFELRYLSIDYLFSCFRVLPFKQFLGFLLQLLVERTSYLTRLSTGMLASLLLYDILPSNSQIDIVGIGLTMTGGYYHDKSRTMTKSGHYSQDIFIAKKMSHCNTGPLVSFTDVSAQTIASSATKDFILDSISNYLEYIKCTTHSNV